MLFTKEIRDGVTLLHFQNKVGMEVVLSPFGASVYAVLLDGEYMTLTPSHMADWLKPNIYHGKTIGRVGNRIKGHSIECEGKLYELEKNEGENTLHGGVHGLSAQTFECEIEEDEEGTTVSFRHLSKEGESGFPGDLDVKSIYRIHEKANRLGLTLKAKSSKRTPCSLTNHSYFKMGEENEDSLRLTIKGSRFIVPDEKTLLGKGVAEVPECLDFTKGRVIGKDVNLPELIQSATMGYDHHFFFDKAGVSAPQIILTGKKYEMEISTDYSGAQLYSDNVADGIAYFGTSSPLHRGCALEPQESHLELHYLAPEDSYEHHIDYVFKRI